MKRRKSYKLLEFWLLWALLLGGLTTCSAAQTTPAIATTAITDTVYRADGTAASGTVLISWPAFTLATGASVPAGSTSVTIGVNGALTVNLVANAGATPMGSYYTVTYHLDDGSVTREYWVVPAAIVGGSGQVQVSAIRSTVLPASVAMQTVSKAYVDTAIATAVAGHPLDSSTPYVLKTGDTMTGPLVLPSDPTTPTQAADKHYVDTQVAALSTGLDQKVSTVPQSTQTVAQPVGTQLQVNNLNGAQYASQYVTGAGTANANNNGIANAAASPDCANGCDIVAEHTYASTEQVAPTTWNNGTHVEDHRGGQDQNSYFNPQGNGGLNAAQTIDMVATQSTQQIANATGTNQVFFTNLQISQEGLAGGSNSNDIQLQAVTPYNKTTYSAAQITGKYNTEGQHVQVAQLQQCYGVGDCLAGAHFIESAGGFRDHGDEGTHPFDLGVSESPYVFTGSCTTGCTPGATVVNITPSSGAGAGTQGEGRYLLDLNPAHTITTGVLTGGVTAGRQPSATFSGTSFPVSVLLETAQTIPTQANSDSPGTVTIPIVTSGVPAGFATNTAALPAASGVACVTDSITSNPVMMYETAAYAVIDGSHLQLTLKRAHANGATIAVGGLCGYGIEQTADTVNGFRQVFPVVASTSPATLLYAGGQTGILGQQGTTSAFVNVSLAVASIARTGNVVAVTFAGALQADVNGLPLTVQGVVDPSYNGTFTVTTTGPSTLTYAENGPDSTSSGGTLTYVTGGYVLYPMAEVTSVYNATTKAVDGQMTLAANTVAWAAGDAVEQPHYYQQAVYPDNQVVTQYLPRPSRRQAAGITYQSNNGPGLIGWGIYNTVPASSYFGNGGTHTVPSIGMQVSGAWQDAMDLQAGEQAAFHVTCNSHGCNRWNSLYQLFKLDAANGQSFINFDPNTGGLAFELNGGEYTFTPQGLTAGTINVTTLNAGSVHGLFTGAVAPSALPVFAGSGIAHAVGAVPDPGATAGTSRFLREDGTWAYAGAQVASAGGYVTNGPSNMPERGNLLGEYLLTEGTGTVAHDTSGQGNDATIVGAAWDGTQDLNFNQQGQYVGLPTALNTARAWQFALYAPVYGTGAAPQAQGYGFASSFPANPSILCGTDAQHLCLVSGTSNRSMQFEATTDSTGAAEPMSPGWHVFTLLCGSNVNGVVTKTRYLYDGAEVGGYRAQGDAGTCPTVAGGNYQIGGSAQFTQTWWFGKVAATWAWSQPLTFGEAVAAAQSALAYLKTKGVQTEFRKVVQPSPVILAGLDSRTYGIGLTSSTVWPATMALTDASYTRIDLGSPGQTAFDACVQFDLTYGLQLGQGSAPAIVALWGGVNDILYTGETPRQIANALHCMVGKAKAAGARVVLATEISCGNSASCDAGKNGLNAILHGEAYGWGVDNLADLGDDPHIGADGASANAACFPDALHPGPACEPYISAIMQDAINELIGSTKTARHTTAAASYAEVAGDRFLNLTGTAAQAVTLPDCTGYSLPREVLNVGAAGATVAAISGQTLTGAGTVGVGTRGVFLPVPGAAATGGCSWLRTQ